MLDGSGSKQHFLVRALCGLLDNRASILNCDISEILYVVCVISLGTYLTSKNKDSLQKLAGMGLFALNSFSINLKTKQKEINNYRNSNICICLFTFAVSADITMLHSKEAHSADLRRNIQIQITENEHKDE